MRPSGPTWWSLPAGTFPPSCIVPHQSAPSGPALVSLIRLPGRSASSVAIVSPSRPVVGSKRQMPRPTPTTSPEFGQRHHAGEVRHRPALQARGLGVEREHRGCPDVDEPEPCRSVAPDRRLAELGAQGVMRDLPAQASVPSSRSPYADGRIELRRRGRDRPAGRRHPRPRPRPGRRPELRRAASRRTALPASPAPAARRRHAGSPRGRPGLSGCAGRRRHPGARPRRPAP